MLEFLRWDDAAHNLSGGESARLAGGSLHGGQLSEGAVADAALLLYQLRHFESARASTSMLLSLIQTSQASISHWGLVWYFLGGLRDCAILPKEMVLDVDTDLLPPNIREDFELTLLEIDKSAFEQAKPVAPKRVKRQNTSLLSLQGLGEALFGGADSDEMRVDSPLDGGLTETDAYNADLVDFKHAFKLDAVSARWDAGYELLASTGANSPVVGSSTAQHTNGEGNLSKSVSNLHQKSIPAFSIVDGGMTVEELRLVIASSGAAQLVSDSRFLSEANLETLLRSLVAVTEAKDARAESPGSTKLDADATENKAAQYSRNVSEELLFVAKEFLSASHTALASKHSFSSATIAWLEMVLVEISLRNRDRFHTFWSILKHHYIRVLSGPLVALSYVTERRVLGILKVCTRMISRDHFSGTILELMGRIFARSSPATESLSPPKGRTGGLDASEDDDSEAYTLSKPHFPPISAHLLQHLSNQISAAMWRVLTLNVELLPMLPLEQWQTLFTIIAISASAGGFSAIKSFEVSYLLSVLILLYLFH